MSTRRDLQALLNDDQTIAALVRLYDRVARQIVKELAKGISRPTSRRATELVARINQLLAPLDPARAKQLRRWINRQIPKAFVLGDEAATAELRKILAAAGRNPGSVSHGFAAINNTSMRGLVASLNATMKGKTEEIRAFIGKVIRDTQQTILDNREIFSITSDGILRGKAGRQVSDDIARMLLGTPDRATLARLRALGFSNAALNDFRSIAEHKMITAGGRRFNIASYADLVARTQMREAHTTGTIIRLQQNDVDHVRISRHRQAELDVCTPFAGKVFFIGPSGTDPLGFRSLREIPNGGSPFHPFCKHVVLPFVVEFKGEEAIENAVASSQALPKRFLGKTPKEVDALIAQMSPQELQAAFPEGIADVQAAQKAA